jgi:hypothetical protein
MQVKKLVLVETYIYILVSKKDKIGAWDPHVRLYPFTKNLIILPTPPHETSL